MSYWYLSIFMVLSLPLLWWLYDLHAKKKKDPSPFWMLRLGRFVFLFVLLALIIRGGSQSYPLTVAHAFQGNKSELAQLRLNSTLTILKSTKAQGLPAMTYFKTDEQAAEILKSNKRPLSQFSTQPPMSSY